MFTDFTYHNLGLPKNPNNPFYNLPLEFNPDGAAHVDLGLGGSLGLASENGKFKTPTLRNVAVTGPWGHNGEFTSLEDMVDFIANRDLEPGRWGSPEVGVNLDGTVGSMNFSAQDVSDVTAFLGTLTDYNMVPEPTTICLLVSGGMLLLARRRRRMHDGQASSRTARRRPMKTLPMIVLCVLAVAAGTAGVAGAGTIAADSFRCGTDPSAGEYIAGAPLAGQNPTVMGFSGAWTGSTTMSGSDTGMSNPSASWACGGGMGMSGTAACSASRSMAGYTNYGSGSGTYYYSGMMQFGGDFVTSNGAMSLTEFFNAGSTGYGVRWGFTSSGTTASAIVRLRTMGQMNSVKTYTVATGLQADTPYLFLIKVRENYSSSNDQISVWLNPTNTASELDAGAAQMTIDFTGMQDSSYAQNMMRFSVSGMMGMGGGMCFDEVCFGTAWCDVVPEPTSMLMLAMVVPWLIRRRRG